jgi:hypothetical protein
MNERVNMDAVITWLYVMETLDTCIESRINGAFVQLLFDLTVAYPTEFDTVLTVREAHRLMGVKHE